MKMGEESLQRLIELAQSLEEDNRKFYGGNNAAGTRLRKGLQEVKKLAQEMRNDVTTTKADRGK
jgi:hypothetical protein